MIISLNWLKKYVKIDLPTEELVRLIGARLVEVEEVIDETHRYDGVFVVQVVSAEKIPDTHLTHCKIDTGKGGIVEILCGAPNVREGMLAAWIAPGATVPASFHEDAPFVIGVRKMRGIDSHGMLAGADELGFSDEHSSIVEIDPEMAKAGDKFADVFGLGDILLDIENKSLTHRPDCFGIIGFAREVAGILGQKFEEPEFLASAGSKHILGQEKIELKIKIDDVDLCPRYEALVMHQKDKTGANYLTEIQTLLARSGVRTIDPVVDMTNYLMLLTGQPLHAFDWDKLVEVGGKKTPEIIVRAAKDGEKMVLLDGKEIEMSENDILITSSGVPVALAGAMGGANTAIDKNTKRIIVESATFSLYRLRKTQMKHGIFSEAITRFTKGQPAGLTDPVVREFAREMAGELTPLALFDEYAKKRPISVVKITTDEINGVLGTKYSYAQIEKTLRNVGFEISCDCGKSDKCKCEKIAVSAPFWRTDIHIKEDIVEEVGRLLGYDNIALDLPKKKMAGAKIDPMLLRKSEIRRILAGIGANEALTYSFVHGDLLKKAKQNTDNSYRIINSISPALEYTRQSIIPSLLSVATRNMKDGFDKFTLFEMNPIANKAYGLTSEKVPVEKPKLGMIHVNSANKNPYYTLKLQVEYLFDTLGVEVNFVPLPEHKGAADMALSLPRSAMIVEKKNQVTLGVIGEITPQVAAEFKLPSTAAAQLHLDELTISKKSKELGLVAEASIVRRDVTLVVRSKTKYDDVFTKVCKVLQEEGLVYVVSPVSIYQGGDKAHKSVSLHLEFANSQKTLSKEEIGDTIGKIEKLEEK